MKVIDINEQNINVAADFIIKAVLTQKITQADLRKYLEAGGYSSDEIVIAESIAYADIFNLVFGRRWNPEGFIEKIPKVAGEA